MAEESKKLLRCQQEDTVRHSFETSPPCFPKPDVSPEDCELYPAVLLAVGPIPQKGWEFFRSDREYLNVYSADMYNKYIDVMGFFRGIGDFDLDEVKIKAEGFLWWYWEKRNEFIKESCRA